MDGEEHSVTGEAPPSHARWTKLLSWDSFRYHGSNWWLDRVLPHSPAGLIAAALLLPATWFSVGFLITDDQAAYLDAADTKYQLFFLALHVIVVRMTASLWMRGINPALARLGIAHDQIVAVRKGGLGHIANLGALVFAAGFIVRDTYMALHVGESGFNAFDDPDMWAYGALGHQIRGMMMGLWALEWLLFGYLFWLQLWTLIRIPIAIRRTDWTAKLSRVLTHDMYREFLTLLARTATLALVFLLGNLGFLYLTDELIPREVVQINGALDVLKQMSDVLSISLLSVAIIASALLQIRTLRKALTSTNNRLFGAAGEAALEAIAEPIQLTGDAATDLRRLQVAFEAQSAVLRSEAFQQKIDHIGGKVISNIYKKAMPVTIAMVKRFAKMQLGSPS